LLRKSYQAWIAASAANVPLIASAFGVRTGAVQNLRCAAATAEASRLADMQVSKRCVSKTQSRVVASAKWPNAPALEANGRCQLFQATTIWGGRGRDSNRDWSL